MGDINFLNTISLGKINRWQGDKESAITPIPFPGEDSYMTEGVDTLGVIKFIKFDGRLTGSDEGISSAISPFNYIGDRIGDIQRIMDGRQTIASKLRSPFVNVRVEDPDNLTEGIRAQGGISTTTSYIPNAIADTKGNFYTRGIKKDDKVKNLISGAVATVTEDPISENLLQLNTDIFGTETNVPYAVSATMRVKLLKFTTKWELPGLSFCDYTLEIMQVR